MNINGEETTCALEQKKSAKQKPTSKIQFNNKKINFRSYIPDLMPLEE